MRCVAVFCKRPDPGCVKTRLAASIGEENAAQLYDAFLRDTVATCRAVKGAEPAIFFAPADAHEYFESLAPGALLVPQPELDFGERVSSLFAELHRRGFERVVVLGGDTPQLAAARIEHAFEQLTEHDVALGPADDGGYYLLGLRAPHPELFEGIEWSSDAVARQTTERAADAGLSLSVLEPEVDVDDLGSLTRLNERLLKETGACPHTRAFLSSPARARLRGLLSS